MIKKLNSSNTSELFKLDNSIFEFDKYSLNQIKEELENNSRLYLGYYDSDNLIGYVGASITLDESDIIKIGVDVNFRNKGIATKLFSALKQELVRLKVTKIMLEVREKNKNAISFYLKNGFLKIATRKNYYNNDNAIILMLEI